MREFSIGQVAREAGIAASALRYYERVGILPPPPRRARQRRYDESVFGRIELIRLALQAGFSISETRTFLCGFSRDTPPAARWRALAARKLEEVDALMQRARRMKALLESSFHCRCPSLADCERYLCDARRVRAAAGARGGRRAFRGPGAAGRRRTAC